MRTCWKWRECAVDATRGFGRWARRCVGARHASNSLFNTYLRTSRSGAARICQPGSRFNDLHTPPISNTHRLVSHTKKIFIRFQRVITLRKMSESISSGCRTRARSLFCCLAGRRRGGRARRARAAVICTPPRCRCSIERVTPPPLHPNPIGSLPVRGSRESRVQRRLRMRRLRTPRRPPRASSRPSSSLLSAPLPRRPPVPASQRLR